MPGAVHEKLREPGRGQHITGGGIDLLGGHSRTDRFQGCSLGL